MISHLLLNARIHTMDDAVPHASALAVRGDKIVAVGGDELKGLAGPNTEVRDLKGATVIPGMTDAHIHWEWTAMSLKRVSLFDMTSKKASIAAVAERVKQTPPGEWIVGFGWAQGIWEDTGGAFPNAADLDAISPNNPVYLKARSGHATWVNSLAMKLAGITDDTPNPPGGEIERDSKGRATGLLLEEAYELAYAAVPKADAETIAAQMIEAQKLAWRCGLTGIHDFDGPTSFEALQLLRDRGQLGMRVLKHINDPYIHHAHALRLRFGFGDDWLKVGALKIFADGALGPVTAYMVEPFEEQPDNYGIVITPKERMQELVLEATRLGFPSTIHAIGDKAVRHVLDVYEAARAEEKRLGIPRDARRHRIEHVQLIHPDDVARLAELDVIASIQPIHATADYPVADRYWGARAKLSYNARIQIDQGVRVAFGSDSPVEPFDAFGGLHAAVTRRRADGSPGPEGWYPEARLSIHEALHGFTTGPAYAAGWENKIGRLAPGLLADLVVLDRDLYEIDPNDLLKVQVKATMVGGEWKYQA